MEELMTRLLTKAANSQSLPSLEAIGEPRAWSELFNSAPGKTDNRCEICQGKKVIANLRVVNGIEYRTAKPCKCSGLDRNVKLARRSGLNALFDKYSFDNFREDKRWQSAAVMKAKGYVANKDKGWFVMGGPPGTGKTHLCVAICHELLERGDEVQYMPWREVAPRLKRAANDKEYDSIIAPYRRAKYLFLDDLFKGGVTEADINLCYELINSRYNTMKPTIISTEKDLAELAKIDEAIGSRIAEMCRGYYVRTEGENYRLKK